MGSIYINFKYAIDTGELHWRSHSIPIHLLTAEVTRKAEERSRASHSNPSQYLLKKFRIKLTRRDKPNQPARPASTYLRDLESSLPQTTNVNLHLVINYSRSYTVYYTYAKISSFMSPSSMSVHFLIREIVNLNLPFDVCRKPDSKSIYCQPCWMK